MGLNIQEKIKRIKKWQKSGFVHELTCGGDNCNKILVHGFCDCDKEDTKGHLVLECPKCDYVQHYIPEAIFNIDYKQFDDVKKMMDKARKKKGIKNE